MMRAAVLVGHNLQELTVQEYLRPQPSAGEVLIKVETVGINQLDLNVIAGMGPGATAGLPRVLGLDPAGVIVEVGDGVDPARIGEPVVVKPNISCGTCPRCLSANEADCPAQTVVGVHRDGGAAQFVAVPARNAFNRGGLAAEVATAAVHSVPIVLNALEAINLAAGERILITGASGSLGRAAVALAKHMGAHVTAASRQLLANDADAVIVQPDAASLAEHLRQEQLSFDAVLDVSGHGPTFAAGIGALAWGGRAVFTGASVDAALLIDARLFYLRRNSLRGVASASYHQVANALQLVESGAVPSLVVARYDLEDIAQAYADYPRTSGGKIVVQVA